MDEEKPVCHEYYCFACDMPSEEHREGSCRCCGRSLTMLAEKRGPACEATCLIGSDRVGGA